MKIKIATWNVNSVRSRLPNILEWIKDSKPDIICLQEIKCIEGVFPSEAFEDLGYNIAIRGRKGHAGVALLSKFPMEDIVKDLPKYGIEVDEEDEARYLETVISVEDKAIRVASIYAPNGGQNLMAGQKVNETARFAYKMKFFDRLRKRFQEILKYNEMGFFCGDYNICPEFIDMYSEKKDGDVTCHIDERRKFRELLNLGMSDAFRAKNPYAKEYSWWDYRTAGWKHGRGLRLDNIMATPLGMDAIKSCGIESKETRGKDKPSDHAPVVCVIEV